MSTNINGNKLDFVAKNGKIAKEWRIILTNQCFEYHKIKHPELLDDNFINNEIKATIESPDNVFWCVKKVLGFYVKRGTIAFYKKVVDNRYILNGKSFTYYIKIVVRRERGKILKIVTAFKTPHINEIKICKPVRKI